MKKPLSIGTVLCAVAVIIYALWGLKVNSNFAYYHHQLEPMPEHLIRLRYAVSTLQRLVLIAAAIGVLFRRDLFRKLLLFMCLYIIATIYWKHPVSCFQKIVDQLVATGSVAPDLMSWMPALVWVLVVINYAFDIAIASVLIFYFTRPAVKSQFRDTGTAG